MNLKYTISLLSLIVLGACGPLTAHSSIAKAHIALQAAEAAGADKFAVFEFRSAQLYLRKAKEEEGFSSFQEAIDFAKKATQFANKASGRAMQNKRAKPRSLQEIQRSRMQGNTPNVAPTGTPAPMPNQMMPTQQQFAPTSVPVAPVPVPVN